MKSILFIINSLNFGGVEKSLIETLKILDKSIYKIDLLIINTTNNNATLIEKIPECVTIIKSSEDCNMFTLDLRNSLKYFFSKGKYLKLVQRIIYSFNSRVFRTQIWSKRVNFMFLRNLYPIIEKTYDIAVSVRYEYPTYYLIECIKAKKKIAWLHTPLNDSKLLMFSIKMEREYLSKMDRIIAVSEFVKESYSTKIPEIKERIVIINNLIDVNEIKNKSLLNTKDIDFNRYKTKIVSIMRLEREKRPIFLIEIAKKLKEKDFDFLLIIIGDGKLRKQCEHLIEKYCLQENVFLLGFKENPYSYLGKSDIYLQPSLFESWGISITEARALGVPCLVSNFASSNEQVSNKNDGFIADDDQDFYSRLEELITNEELLRKFKYNSKINLNDFLCMNIKLTNEIGEEKC